MWFVPMVITGENMLAFSLTDVTKTQIMVVYYLTNAATAQKVFMPMVPWFTCKNVSNV